MVDRLAAAFPALEGPTVNYVNKKSNSDGFHRFARFRGRVSDLRRN
jgi:hypothetical protein